MKNPAFLLNLSSGSVRTVEDEFEKAAEGRIVPAAPPTAEQV
jgi:hypothetical protein